MLLSAVGAYPRWNDLEQAQGSALRHPHIDRLFVIFVGHVPVTVRKPLGQLRRALLTDLDLAVDCDPVFLLADVVDDDVEPAELFDGGLGRASCSALRQPLEGRAWPVRES